MPTIRLDDAELRRALRALARHLDDPAPALAEIGEVLLRSTRARFAAGRDPRGRPWAPLSPVTIARKGHARPLIGDSGALRLIRYRLAGRHSVEVGTGAVYGATHQFGARRGRFGRTRRGAPIPWGDIPARPFLGLSDADRRDVLAILREFLETS